MCVNLEMWQVMAAANALSVNILSVYPFLGPKCYQSFYNRTCRAKKVRSSHAFAIFWSSAPEHDLTMPHDYWTANHVVPLVSFRKFC